jgi:ATP-dependent RNA helicase RhlE
VSVKEQRKFMAIEKLIGKPVPRSEVPAAFGEVPEYNPSAQRDRGQGGGGFKPRRFNSGGKKGR